MLIFLLKQDSWVLMIRQKFRNERRKLTSSRVTENWQKFGSVEKWPLTSEQTNAKKKGKVHEMLVSTLPSKEWF